MSNNVIIDEGSFKQIQKESIVVVVGPKNSGKTTNIRTILYYLSPFIRTSLLISNTAHVTGDFNGIIPETFSYQKYDPSIVKNLMRYQFMHIDKSDKLDSYSKYKRGCVVVMDDIFAQLKKYKNDENYIGLMTEGRHAAMTIIIGTHDVLGIPSKIRGQIDYLIVTRESRKKRLQEIYDNYWQHGHIEYKQFSKILADCTVGYKSMLIDIRKSGRPGVKIEDSVFFLQPPSKLPPFKMGIKSMWDINQKILDPNWKKKKWLSPDNKKHETVVLRPKHQKTKHKTRKKNIISFND